ncbi:MAG: hypothetical protein WCD59_11165, partial [Pseudolabrys sp.]
MQIRSLNRRSAVIAASAVVLAAICSTPVAVQAQQKNVKIAVIVPLSGPWARQGTLVKYGAETAVNEINAAGHVAYCTAKGGVINLTHQLAVDFGPQGV